MKKRTQILKTKVIPEQYKHAAAIRVAGNRLKEAYSRWIDAVSEYNLTINMSKQPDWGILTINMPGSIKK